MQLVKIENTSDLQHLVEMAAEIWHEYYLPLLGQAQIDYMLNKFQSLAAVTRQIAEGYDYFLMVEAQNKVGYLSVFRDTAQQSMLLSKFYVLKPFRQRGFGRNALEQLQECAHQQGLVEIVLTVNKQNTPAITAYHRLGFVISEAICNDIGQGFQMDDYKMKKYFIASEIEAFCKNAK